MNVPLLDLKAQYASIRDEVRAAIDTILDDQALVLGPVTQRFEEQLASYCGTKHAIGLSSGTDALLAPLMAMDLKAGDEVICPSFTFFATAGSIARLGGVPVFVDIDPDTFNIDAKLIERKITKKTRAIMPVHLFGQMAEVETINAIACHHELLVIEDAAQAIGARRHDKAACNHGWCGALSFYPTKNLGAAGDAGAVCTNDDELAAKLKKIRVHGSGHTYFHETVGGNFRIDALQAAVLEVKLRYLNQWHEARRRHADIYNRAFAGSRVLAPPIAAGNWSIYNQYVVRVSNRDHVKAELTKRGIGSAVYYPLSLHQQQCFAYLGYHTGDLPESERAAAEVLALPVYPELKSEQIEHVAQTLLTIVSD